jgi:serine protease Do
MPKSRWWYPLFIAVLLGGVAGVLGAYLWTRESGSRADGAREPVMLPDPQPAVVQGVSAQDEISQSRQNAITRSAALVGPAVVTITVVQTRVVRATPGFDDFWSRFFMPRYYQKKVRSIGSGVIVSPEGFILTNDHVTEDASEIQVALADGRVFDGSLVGEARESDLAVVKIEGDNLPVARLGDSDSLLIGEWAIAVGNPFGYLLADTKPTVTVGVISAIDRDVRQSPDDERVYRKVIQTDAAINPGNSGGPLVDAEGRVIGINSFIFSSSRGSEGIGFAIPINQAKVIFSDLVRYGEIRPAWVGVGIQSIQDVFGEPSVQSQGRGVVVTSVRPASPAFKAGLKQHDIIRRADGKLIASVADWDGLAAFWRPGQTVRLEYTRDGEARSTALSLVSRPLDVAPSRHTGAGLWVTDIDADIAAQLGVDDRGGAAVVRVDPRSAAEAAGLQSGDIIRQLNNRAVENAGQLESVLKRGSGIRLLLGVEREGKLYLTALDL